MGRRLVVALAALLALPSPATASATARFASPAGTGTACTQAAPCDVVTAVNNAASGDDVTIEPGSYAVTNTLDDGGSTLTIHGQAGSPRPVITNSATNGVELMGSGSSLSYVELDITSGSGAGIGTTGNQTIDRVVVKVSNLTDTNPACTVTGTMTNTVCWTAASNGIAAFNGSFGVTAAATLRNDTLEAPGTNGVGVDVEALGGGASPSIALINSITHGGAKDLVATNSGGTSATITADHTNFATSQTGTGASAPAPGSGTNQIAPPQFANAATGDFHELGSSPTVDAGVDSAANGSLDDDGLPRTMGARTDIGAFEHPVPVCQPLTATTFAGHALTKQLSCADPSGAPITSYAVVAPPAHGTVSVNSSGVATYVPASGYSGPDSFGFDATSSNGTGATATATITVAPATASNPPALTNVRQSHKRWREGNALPHTARAKRPPVGTTFRFSVNESARVRFRFTQRLPGRRVGSRCVKPTSKNSHKRRCTRTLSRGSLTFSPDAGAHKVGFDGRLSKHKKLPAGRYMLIITATNAVGQTATAKLTFTIVRG